MMDSPSRHRVHPRLLPLLGAFPTFEFIAEQLPQIVPSRCRSGRWNRRDSLGALKRSLIG